MTTAALTAARVAPVPSRVSDYWALIKPGIVAMVVMTSLAGYLAGMEGPLSFSHLAAALLGTAMAAAGGAALNMALEVRVDGRMLRTASRPLPAGRVHAAEAVVLAVLLSFAGYALLAARSGGLAALLAAATTLVYGGIYTPLKVRSRAALLVGAVSGALPPLIGYAAAAGRLDRTAFILFAVLFFWQVPHFLALAWIYREDYARAGMRFPPVTDASGASTSSQAITYSLLFAAAALTPVAFGASALYALVAAATCAPFVVFAFAFAKDRTTRRARGLFLASITTLPAVLTWLVLQKLFTL